MLRQEHIKHAAQQPSGPGIGNYDLTLSLKAGATVHMMQVNASFLYSYITKYMQNQKVRWTSYQVAKQVMKKVKKILYVTESTAAIAPYNQSAWYCEKSIFKEKRFFRLKKKEQIYSPFKK